MKKVFTLSVISLLLFPLPSAHSSTGYRYWGYFQAKPGETSWSYALTGPTTNIPDGSVEGWAFTFSGDSVPNAASPKIAPIFSTICSGKKVDGEHKRVALVIDFGPAALRPRGENLPRAIVRCVIAKKSATGGEILASVVSVRNSSSGFTCGINSYPAKECGIEIKTPRTLVSK